MNNPKIIHYLIGDGKPPLGKPTTTIRHYGIVAENGLMPDGNTVVQGTILSVDKVVAEEDALEYLQGSKKIIHRALDHRRSIHTCKEEVCGEIQEQIDGLKAVTVLK